MDRHLNDQEQVEVLKRFWGKWGNRILTAIVVVALCIAGWHLYNRYHKDQLEKASMAYTQLLNQMLVPANAFDQKAFTKQANLIVKKYDSTGYATLSAMLLAKTEIEHKQLSNAEAVLQQALTRTDNFAYKAILKGRIAKLLIMQGKPEQALGFVAKAPKGYEVPYGMISAEAYTALKQYRQARAAYEDVLTHLPAHSDLRKVIHVELSGLQA